MNKKIALLLVFLTIFGSGVTKAQDGCGSNQCCCKYLDSLGRANYACTTRSTNECSEILNGNCGNMGKCSSSKNQDDTLVCSSEVETEQQDELPVKTKKLFGNSES